MRTGILVLFLALSTTAVAEAQTQKRLSFGGGLSFNDYSDSRFNAKNNFGFVPMYSLNRGTGTDGWGWDLKTAISFTQIDATTEATGAEVQLGKVRTIPLFVGVGRVYRQGPMKVGGWVTGGPSFNDFEIDDQALSAYQAAGSTLEAVHVKTSWAFRPGVSASYDLSSWLALQGALSYTINRPEVHTVVDGVRTSETWNLDHSNAALGLVVGLF